MNIKEIYKLALKNLVKDNNIKNITKAKQLINENDFIIVSNLMDNINIPGNQRVDLYNYKDEWKNEFYKEFNEEIEKIKEQEKAMRENEKLISQINKEEAKRRKELEKQAREQLKEEERRKQQKNVLIAVVLACMVYFITIIYMFVGR